ncbi:hypothetical protein F7725_011119 [Dissostichus mawsoni]|uniref:Uncharacterized protein n=1 Tax=Dissostichus mawsoni TaxID=36200 RepID=A0A7J5ZC47_DISMA|nr:hypothetical protein F7725_011119 [Dissostichus mawsoni]
MMDNKRGQLQRGFENYMDRGTDVRSCPHPTADIKFPDIDEATVSFTIKEESPDEMLWISESARPIGSAGQYRRPANAPESQQLEEDRQLNLSEGGTRKSSEFSDLYNSAAHAGDISGLQFTVKTEKQEDRSGFSQDGCQHGAAKQTPLAADFSLDERDSQLWSSIIEGDDIDAGFPDFSSVVEEYSNTFPDHSDVGSTKAASTQRPCNGMYNSEFQKDGPQSSGFQPRPQGGPQRNPSHPDEHSDRESAASDRPVVSHSHVQTGSFHPPPPTDLSPDRLGDSPARTAGRPSAVMKLGMCSGVVVVLQPGDHGGHQLLQLLRPLPARLQHLLVVGLLLAVVVHHRPVADQRQGEAAHPGVTRNDDLVRASAPSFSSMRHSAMVSKDGPPRTQYTPSLKKSLPPAAFVRKTVCTPISLKTRMGILGMSQYLKYCGSFSISASPPRPEPHTIPTVGRTCVLDSSQSAVARHSS